MIKLAGFKQVLGHIVHSVCTLYTVLKLNRFYPILGSYKLHNKEIFITKTYEIRFILFNFIFTECHLSLILYIMFKNVQTRLIGRKRKIVLVVLWYCIRWPSNFEAHTKHIFKRKSLKKYPNQNIKHQHNTKHINPNRK